MEPGRPSKRTMTPPSGGEAATRKRRVTVAVACNFCRARKIRCDGVKPVCGTCVVRELECHFAHELPRAARMEVLRQENLALTDQVTGLKRQLAETQASLSKSLRRRPVSPDNIVAWPSSHQLLRASLPPTETSMEFELMCKHPNAYQVLEPYPDRELVANTVLCFSVEPRNDDVSNHVPHSQRLASPRVLCDERLKNLDISYWTTVPISSPLAASVLSLYLEAQHPMVGTFDAGLFIQDLVGRQLRFCSPLLVNAVLYWASQGWTFFDRTASQLTLAFYAEAVQLWRTDKHSDSLLTVAAMQIMSFAATCNGNDQQGQEFLSVGRNMAERLGLMEDKFSPPMDMSTSPEGSIDDETRFRAHIAWGSFASMNNHSFYYRRPPTRGIPYMPMPGSPGFPLPSYMGSTMTSLCRLMELTREIALLYQGDPTNIHARVSVAALESKCQQLLAFGDGFESRSYVLPHHVYNLQLWYHSAVISFMQPWVGKQIVFRSFTSSGSSPEGITAASLRQLKRLMIELRLNYPLAPVSVNWHTSLVYIANHALSASHRDDEWQFYFMSALAGYSILTPAYRLGEIIFKALLTMAVDSGKFPVATARRLFKENAMRGKHHHALDSFTSSISDFNVDLSRPTTNTAGDLAARFETIVSLNAIDDEVSPIDTSEDDSDVAHVFDQFTHQDREVSSSGLILGESQENPMDV